MAGFVKRLLGRLGTLFVKEENNEKQQQPPVSVNDCVKPSQGFSVKIAVPADSVPQGPVVCQCLSGDGGVQGFSWYSQKLQVDEDGDFAEEFLNEVLPDLTGSDGSREVPRLKVNPSTNPAKLASRMFTESGIVYQSVEHAGGLRWV